MQAVILAGGMGKRLGQKTKNNPKPMIRVGQVPVIEHQINLLKSYGIKRIIILTGYLSEKIKDFLENKKNFGLDIKCLKSDIEIGNADRLKLAEKYLNKDFILFYGDIIMDIDIKRVINFHEKKKSFYTLIIHPNDHPHDSDLIEIDKNQRVIAIHEKPHPQNKYFKNLTNSGIYIFNPRIFKHINSKGDSEQDLARHIIPKIIGQKKFFGYNTSEYIKDIGTSERLKQANNDYLSGKIKKLNIRNKRKAIFLDRDGTINYDLGNSLKIDKFRLLPKTIKAIKLINLSDYLAIIVTNQPLVAKGFLTIKEVEEINKKMETLIGQGGAKLDGIYYCPHHPEKGYPNENSKYTIQCKCRKPQIGMFKKAKKDFNIDLSKSWIIGDSERDIISGYNACIKTVLIKNNQKEFERCRINTKKATDLYSAIKFILK